MVVAIYELKMNDIVQRARQLRRGTGFEQHELGHVFEHQVRTGRTYRQNDVLLRFGPCPAGFTQLSSLDEVTPLSVSTSNQEGVIATGQSREVDEKDISGNFFGQRPYLISACVCAEQVCR